MGTHCIYEDFLSPPFPPVSLYMPPGILLPTDPGCEIDYFDDQTFELDYPGSGSAAIRQFAETFIDIQRIDTHVIGHLPEPCENFDLEPGSAAFGGWEGPPKFYRAYFWASLEVRCVGGKCELAFALRFEHRAVMGNPEFPPYNWIYFGSITLAQTVYVQRKRIEPGAVIKLPFKAPYPHVSTLSVGSGGHIPTYMPWVINDDGQRYVELTF